MTDWTTATKEEHIEIVKAFRNALRQGIENLFELENAIRNGKDVKCMGTPLQSSLIYFIDGKWKDAIISERFSSFDGMASYDKFMELYAK